MNINVKKTILNAVNVNDEFPFYVDELSKNNTMPTYMGLADEKYTFYEMNDEFFDFISRKINKNGIYIRLVHVFGEAFGFTNPEDIIEINTQGNISTFGIETGKFKKDIKTNEQIEVCDVLDYGVKIKGNEISFGTTIFLDYNHLPYFAEFGSVNKNRDLSLNNPLNKSLIEIMKDCIIYDK
ncbi:hypothetical protein [Methanobrevibacter oralis]|uniref:Uncharacterized protein n=1 Tax=Methanobrevibacter oralis TaxID=66851 RepID=A0A166BR02_METOA|nr:hypothetical protein [Methanobrevibacter oralis]KZX13703.1 hypothetical protein MBORA_04090 [Methanobrevibacter oralis]